MKPPFFLLSTTLFLFLKTTSFANTISQSTLFSLERINYKPEKILHYDVSYDSNACLFTQKNPFDLYYVDRVSGERLSEFSSNSKQYFSPEILDSATGQSQIELNFKALEEIRSALNTDQKIFVILKQVEGQCLAEARIEGEGRSSQLLKIEMKMKIKFGLPVNTVWVQTTENYQGEVIKNCLTDACNP